ncbi:uncharacterized protein LOC142503306 [Ascaphus truei]|uniref:uncharacterized protein LOC142503306 n=1 Tax=Ascaphus truei TaxID=8439 RepID=UPI003F5928EC
MEQVSSPGSASSTLLEEHHGDEDDEYDEDDATEETEIQSCDHEEVPIETVVPPNRPSTSTYDAIVASEGKIVDAENRRHSDMMTVLERMIGLQEETVSQLAHLHRVFIEVPKQLQKINTSFEALVVQQTQANYWRMTNVPQFNTSQPGSVHAVPQFVDTGLEEITFRLLSSCSCLNTEEREARVAPSTVQARCENRLKLKNKEKEGSKESFTKPR